MPRGGAKHVSSKGEFNPKRPVPCERGCGLVILKDKLAEHNCVQELQALIATQQEKLNDYEQELAEHKRAHQEKLNDYEQELAELKRAHQEKLNDYEQELAELKRAHQEKLNDYEQELAEHKRELAELKEFKQERLLNPSSRALVEQRELEEVVRWANTLDRATITFWDILIPTPDNHIKMSIKGSLTESGCPPHIIDDLMKNCEIGRWPPCLRCLVECGTLSDRVFNTNYVCRRVPGQHAILILHCDNTHVDQHMMVEPGFIMSFRYAGIV